MKAQNNEIANNDLETTNNDPEMTNPDREMARSVSLFALSVSLFADQNQFADQNLPISIRICRSVSKLADKYQDLLISITLVDYFPICQSHFADQYHFWLFGITFCRPVLLFADQDHNLLIRITIC